MAGGYLVYSRILVLLASVSITFGLWDQAQKIWRTKSAKDFTASIVVAILINEAAWLNYGFALHEWPIIVIGLANNPAAIWAGLGFWKYRRWKDAA